MKRDGASNSPEEILRRAEDAIGQQGYILFFDTCEDFTKFCVLRHGPSTEIVSSAGFGIVIILGIILTALLIGEVFSLYFGLVFSSILGLVFGSILGLAFGSFVSSSCSAGSYLMTWRQDL